MSTLSNTSILLVASVIPAPTRTLYASTKVASLVLYQALSTEHPRIAFTVYMPFTVQALQGDFRASAVDAGPVSDPNTHGLKREYVAQRCVQAIDKGEKTIFTFCSPLLDLTVVYQKRKRNTNFLYHNHILFVRLNKILWTTHLALIAMLIL
jgi:short-subunit dehydrogenase